MLTFRRHSNHARYAGSLPERQLQGDICFYCRATVRGVGIEPERWMLRSGYLRSEPASLGIVLHPECARSIWISLGIDLDICDDRLPGSIAYSTRATLGLEPAEKRGADSIRYPPAAIPPEEEQAREEQGQR